MEMSINLIIVIIIQQLLLLLLLLWQCEIHRYADIIKFGRAVYTL